MATCVRKIFKKVRPSNFLQGASVLRSTSANLSTTSTGCAYAKVREEEEIPFAQYGGRFRVTMLPGSGIGPEMMGYVKEVFRYAGIPIDFETVNISTSTDSAEDVHHAVSSIKRNGVAIKGNIETRMNEPGIKSRNVILRNELNLFVNVVHCYSQPGIITRHKDVDIAIVRMNIEGEYAMLEHENVPGVIESLKVVTRETSERVARFAYNWAREKGKNKVHIIHKANIMKLSDGLFMDTCKEVSKDYPDIETETMIVDNTCMQLASNPQQFQVMVTPNLYGSIIGNLVCGLVGGAGLFSGRNYGERYAVFEPGTRNTGSSMVGKNIANPHAMLKAGVDLLEHLNLTCHAQLLRDCLWQTINVDRVHTPDLGGYATSLDFVQHVIHHIQEKTKDLNWQDNLRNNLEPSGVPRQFFY